MMSFSAWLAPPWKPEHHVGTGFTQDMLTDLMGQLGSLGRDESPFGTNS